MYVWQGWNQFFDLVSLAALFIFARAGGELGAFVWSKRTAHSDVTKPLFRAVGSLVAVVIVVFVVMVIGSIARLNVTWLQILYASSIPPESFPREPIEVRIFRDEPVAVYVVKKPDPPPSPTSSGYWFGKP